MIFPAAIAITLSPLFCLFCFNICSVSSGLCAMSFNALNTHHLFGWHRCLPMTALLWKLSRWLLHIRPDLPVALAKPMLTVGLFHSLILKSRFGPPPTRQNTPRCPRAWSGHAVTVSEVGKVVFSATFKCLIWCSHLVDDDKIYICMRSGSEAMKIHT